MGLITVNSRKGGTGKTSVLLAIALNLAKKKNVCVIDFDISGPSWVFLLNHLGLNLDGEIKTIDRYFMPYDFPGKYNFTDYPVKVNFMDDETSFDVVFMRPSTSVIQKLDEQLQLLDSLDIMEMLDNFLKALGAKYQYILLDNSPGNIQHSIYANQMTYENEDDVRIFVSSADVPDLAGILYELDTLKTLQIKGKTIWLLNKIPPKPKIQSFYGETVGKSRGIRIAKLIIQTIVMYHPQLLQAEAFKSFSLIEQMMENPEKELNLVYVGHLVEEKAFETFAFKTVFFNGNEEDFQKANFRPPPLVDIKAFKKLDFYKNIEKNIVPLLKGSK